MRLLFEEHVVPSDPPNKGWNRASIIFWSRKPYRPRLTDEDREPTRGRGAGMLAICGVAGSLVSVSLVWFVLFVVNMYRPLSGPVTGSVLAGSAIALTAFMYAVAARR